MANNKIGITLNDATLKLLEEESKRKGVSKSAYISLLINQVGKGERQIK